MKHFVLLDTTEDQRGDALSSAARAFAADADWPHPVALRLPGPGFRELIVWGEDAADVLDGDRGEAAVLLARAAFDEHGERVTPRSLLQRVAASGPSALRDVAAPQSVVFAFSDPAQVIAATDRVGLSAVYHHAGGDTRAVSSSSRLLAAIFGCPLDDEALGAFAALGEFAATDTPFRGVQRLGPGGFVKLAPGGLALGEYARLAAPRPGARDVETVVAEGVAAVRAAVDACQAAYPDAGMELSGGLDSRLILAALLAAGHAPTEGITLGEPDHPDVTIAATLAARAGIPQRRVDLTDMAGLTPPEALALVDTAGRRRDYSGNCVALGVLDWVEPLAGTGPRFSGQNGELARGFYYPFQPAWPRTTDLLARTLVRWRLMANERAAGGLLAPEVNAAGERRAVRTTQALLERTGCDWLTATDMLYLNWRMQRWVGCDWSAAAQTRTILAPFFHARYVDWALSAPPQMKRGSRLLARVLHELSPELAALPTAGGAPPAAMHDPRPADRLAQTRRTAGKVAVKVRQRVRDTAKPPVGAPVLAQLALDAMAEERVGLERVAALPFVSEGFVEQAAETRAASAATVGMLVALRGLVLDGTPAGRASAPEILLGS